MRLAIAFIGCTLSGCLFDPDYKIGNCEVRCEDACPDGFDCRDGFCVDRDYAGACYEPLRIHAPSDVQQSGCEELVVPMGAEGGSGGALQWSVVGKLPDGFQLEHDDDEATLRAPSQALSDRTFASIVIEVRDGFGHSTSETVDVDIRHCAKAVTPAPEPLCEGVPVNIALKAKDGWGNYQWSIEGELPPGLELERDALVGTVDEAAAGSYPVVVTLRDVESAGADAEPRDEDTQQLTLEVRDCLRVSPAQQETVCVNDPYVEALEAQGGEPPYEWRVDNLPSDFSFDESTGVLEGSTSRVGPAKIAVRVRDANDEEFRYSYTLDVHPCPTMRPQAIVACEGDSVQLDLEADAHVGEPSWEKLRGPKWLRVAPRGQVTGTAQPGDDELVVLVSDDAGSRESSLPVAVRSKQDDACDELIPPDALPPACAGQKYEHRLLASDASAAWYPKQADEWPSWLTLDDNGLLHGVAPASAQPLDIPLGVGLIADGSPLQFNNYRLRIRPTCKFLFVGAQLGAERLFLGDLRQGIWPDPLPPKDLSAALPESFDVGLFEPSPDGAKVAFVATGREQSASDQLLLAGTRADIEVPEGVLEIPNLATVQRLAWSLDSSVLAVMYLSQSDDAFVTTIGFSGAEPLHNADIPLQGLAVQELMWLGPRLCYPEGFDAPPVAGTEPNAAGLFCHDVDENGSLGTAHVARAQWADDFNESGGLDYVVSGNEMFLYMMPGVSDPFIGHYYYDDGVTSWNQPAYYGIPDPSFTWLAQPGTALQRDQEHPEVSVFEIAPETQTYGDVFEGNGTATDCHRVDAWENKGAALGCRDDAGLRIALIDDEGAVSRTQSVADSADFLENGMRKAFTTGASWFVYATMSGTVRVVDLSGDDWVSTVALDDASDGVDLAPLPSSSQLLVHSGKLLRLVDLQSGDVEILGDDLKKPNTCGADFRIYGPHAWCGGPWLPSVVSLPSDGSGAVFPHRDGVLYSVDMAGGVPAAATAVSDAIVTCRDGCDDRVKFVP